MFTRRLNSYLERKLSNLGVGISQLRLNTDLPCIDYRRIRCAEVVRKVDEFAQKAISAAYDSMELTSIMPHDANLVAVAMHQDQVIGSVAFLSDQSANPLPFEKLKISPSVLPDRKTESFYECARLALAEPFQKTTADIYRNLLRFVRSLALRTEVHRAYYYAPRQTSSMHRKVLTDGLGDVVTDVPISGFIGSKTGKDIEIALSRWDICDEYAAGELADSSVGQGQNLRCIELPVNNLQRLNNLEQYAYVCRLLQQLKPGGSIIAAELDWASFVCHVAGMPHVDALALQAHASSQVANPATARNLMSLFARAGVEQIQVQRVELTVSSLHVCMLLLGLHNRLSGYSAEAQYVLALLKQADELGVFSVEVSFVVARASRPLSFSV